jgi:3-deoxy-manno-octulosonate cytidylyltransferase (CMP-KDO synthetase)
VQGDEPEIDPRHLDALVELLETDPGAQVGTLACPFAVIPGSDPRDPNAVKVVVSAGGRAIYFSRSLIPYPRGHEASGGTLPPHAQGAPAGGRTHQPAPYLLHVGVYAYRPAFLARLGTLAPTPLERTEQLEQLRWLEHGFAIAVRIVDGANKGIDTPEIMRRSWSGVGKRARGGGKQETCGAGLVFRFPGLRPGARIARAWLSDSVGFELGFFQYAAMGR